MEHNLKNELTEGWKCYFIEHKESRLWISEKGEEETYNPCEAKQFQTIQEADKYILDNNLGEWYYSTEHDFFTTID